MSGTLRINEIFHSIQGESTYAGSPCVFVRLTGCHLRCAYCDTEYAFKEGTTQPIDDVVSQVLAYNCNLIEITGGEPLLQPRVFDLMRTLCDAGKTVLVETSGACDIDGNGECDPRVIRIMDLKTPGSGESARNDLANIARLRPSDEVKFVICDRADYEWARSMIRAHALDQKVNAILMSAVFEQRAGLEILGHKGLPMRDLAQWILADGLPVRMQTQLHKFIWEPQTRGV
ncbi:MAG: radical SAM protein [Phycisphaeraceae bacterium]|nr:radical SAM protein [Phycisphaerales bacterium]MCB9843217.1 radical SAM protein [Phycisphaeraceae bacterium]